MPSVPPPPPKPGAGRGGSRRRTSRRPRSAGSRHCRREELASVSLGGGRERTGSPRRAGGGDPSRAKRERRPRARPPAALPSAVGRARPAPLRHAPRGGLAGGADGARPPPASRPAVKAPLPTQRVLRRVEAARPPLRRSGPRRPRPLGPPGERGARRGQPSQPEDLNCQWPPGAVSPPWQRPGGGRAGLAAAGVILSGRGDPNSQRVF